MSGYRDQLEAARLRIESLEANLAERNAALGAREAELRELAAKLGRREPSAQAPRPPAAWALIFGAGLVAAVTLFANSHARQQLRMTEARAEMLAHTVKLCEERNALSPRAPADEPPPYAAERRDEPPAVPEPAFDRRAASRALNEAAGQARRSCWRADAPKLPLRVRVTFSPSGKASEVSTDAPVHTAAGRCLERVFTQAKVPPFEGAPMHVSTLFAWR
ncbi:MAG TPA: hypothetical protein VFS43_43830 [Polyangiaceae bacterium]|nr:hypothetical protein [Polyangiaceae bacterium]